jgi:hypothetical protein
MCFASWDKFREEFMAAFCPENEATTVLMRLESDQYFQGKQNIETYIDEFKDLVDLSGYTDPIAIMLKFRRGLHCKGTSVHFLTSPLISHFPLSICIPHPHLCTISKDHTYSR